MNSNLYINLETNDGFSISNAKLDKIAIKGQHIEIFYSNEDNGKAYYYYTRRSSIRSMLVF